MHLVLLFIALALYIAATASFLGHLLSSRAGMRRAGLWLLGAALAVHSGAIFSRGVEQGHVPITTFHDALSLLAWFVVGAYLFLQARYPLAALGAFVSPLAFIFTVWAYMFFSGARDLAARLPSAWLPAHIAPTVLGYAILGVSFCLSLTYLLQERQLKAKARSGLFRRLPSLETLDRLNHQSVTWGFSLFTVGILAGSVLAKSAWGHFWSWEPLEVWSAATWVLYAVLLHARSVGWGGRKSARLTIYGFGLLLVSFFGVSLVYPGRHGLG